MQPDEEGSGGQASGDISQTDQQIPESEPVEEVAVYDDGSGADEEPGIPAPDEAASAVPEPAKEDIKIESPEMVRLREVEKKLADVNKALHQERQRKKEEKTEDALTPEQIQQIIRDHGDDPATMYNVFDYMSKQAAKQVTKETVDVQRVEKMREAGNAIVQNKWPALNEPDSPLRAEVERAKADLNLGDHPMADYLAASALTAIHIDSIKQHWFEAGKAEALKGKSEAARKADVKNNTLVKSAPATGRRPSIDDSVISAGIAQLNMTPGQAKEYRRIMSKKSNNMVEA